MSGLHTATLAAIMGFALACCSPAPSPSAPPPSSPPVSQLATQLAPQLVSEDDKTLYALGVLLGRNVQDLHLSDSQVQLVALGLIDQAQARAPRVDLAVYAGKAQQWATARRDQLTATNAAARRAQDRPFEEAAAREPNAHALPGGAILKTVVVGHGESPNPSDRVRLSYEAHLTDGTEFDTTDKHGGEARLALNEALPCMKEALLQMHPAETVQLVCPATLAYGEPGRPPKVPGGATVVFRLSLLEINPKEAPPEPKPALR